MKIIEKIDFLLFTGIVVVRRQKVGMCRLANKDETKERCKLRRRISQLPFSRAVCSPFLLFAVWV